MTKGLITNRVNMKSRQDPFFLYWRVENVQLKTEIFAKYVWLYGWFLEDLFWGKTIILRQDLRIFWGTI